MRRMFELCADGAGLTRITKTLNADGVPAPRPQQGRPVGWTPSTVRAVLRRELYRGVIVWNQTRKRDRWGQHHQHARPEAEWMRLPGPALRIVSEDLWTGAQAQLARRKAAYSGGGRSHRASRYLLSGFARCAVCGGGFAAHGREHGDHMVQFYGCTSFWKRGATVCGNNLVGRMDLLDAEVLATLQDDVLRPTVVDRAIALVLEELTPTGQAHQRDVLAEQLAKVDAECERLTDAIMGGGALDVLVRRLQARQARREEIEAAMALRPSPVPAGARVALERRLRTKLADWRGLLTKNVESGREVLKALLEGPLRFTPLVDERRRAYRFTGTITLERLLSGVVELPTRVTSPGGTADGWPMPLRGYFDRRAA